MDFESRTLGIHGRSRSWGAGPIPQVELSGAGVRVHLPVRHTSRASRVESDCPPWRGSGAVGRQPRLSPDHFTLVVHKVWIGADREQRASVANVPAHSRLHERSLSCRIHVLWPSATSISKTFCRFCFFGRPPAHSLVVRWARGRTVL